MELIEYDSFFQPFDVAVVVSLLQNAIFMYLLTCLFPSQDPGTLEHFGFGTTSGVTYYKKHGIDWIGFIFQSLNVAVVVSLLQNAMFM